MIPRNQRLIDLSIFRDNVRHIRQCVPPGVKLLAVVKADGYGHGALAISQAAIECGADMLAVATVEEGCVLRAGGITVPILILGIVSAEESISAVRSGLIQTVCSTETIEQAEQSAKTLNTSAEVHIKIDSGMGRIGIRTTAELYEIMDKLSDCSHTVLSGVYTHFSDSDGDESGEAYTKAQYAQFLQMVSLLPKGIVRHCCNSAALERFPEMSLDMVRAGISMYGYPPISGNIPLSPCMTWRARISYIKELPAGAAVSYGRTYICSAPVRTATITCGYGDGYFRAASNKGYVLIRGKRARIIGRICMDQMMADITSINDAAVGDEVILIGQSGSEQITAEDIAGWCDTISYEILLHSSDRVERVIVDPKKA